jgi:hypothetical protein
MNHRLALFRLLCCHSSAHHHYSQMKLTPMMHQLNFHNVLLIQFSLAPNLLPADPPHV